MNQKGITLTALVVTIIVMLILGVVSFSVGFQLMDFSRVRNSVTALNMTRAEVEKIFEEFATEFTYESLGGNYERINNYMQVEADTDAFNILKLVTRGAREGDNYSEHVQVSEVKTLVDSKGTADEIAHFNEEMVKRNEYGNDTQNYFWFKWKINALALLHLDIKTISKSNSDIYVNYYTGEVVFPDGVKSDTGEEFITLSGLESADWLDTNP